MKRTTISDIAREAGVSKGAVSYALNGRPGVSEATRSRITAIAARMGWAPSSVARALSGGRAGAFGLVIDRPAEVLAAEPFFMRLIAGIQHELGPGPTSLVLQVSPDHDTELEIYHRWHAERRVDGVLLIDLRADDNRLDVLASIGLPAVVIGEPLGRTDIPSAWIDDRAAIDEVLDYLVALGHRRVVRVAGPREFLHSRMRSAAFLAAAARVGLEAADVVHTDYSGESGAAAARRALVSALPPTAMVFDNDVMAVAALGVAQELGLSVPGQLSLIAWEDSLLCRLVRPALSAVRRPVGEFGALAVSLLRQVVTGASVSDACTSAPILVTRASSGPVCRDRPDVSPWASTADWFVPPRFP
ncbi:LacI family DNA-binding transcriptional regulator [Amycolatopsis sp. H20-H5]|uniref:LacI family DNA-binding transcriptional regulator n=1 Tax=Amycolatopsis sp. H20-H5 TaxID=3046309 RepID=UPI002DBCFDD3|nr:LacI family DNA-binding transcriptional regulator [Amycolatopsis sp. H20-H5]MEC3982220.1 LacI family DNA-binding transcriptional regulator [Amycolatopsis sp. H20-H5]